MLGGTVRYRRNACGENGCHECVRCMYFTVQFCATMAVPSHSTYCAIGVRLSMERDKWREVNRARGETDQLINCKG